MPYIIDYDILIAGGLLHDVGKLLEIGKNNNWECISFRWDWII